MSKIQTLPLEDLISDNKEIFYSELKEAINPSFTGLDNPKKYKSILESIITTSDRKPFPRQARLISAASEYLSQKKNKALLISAEMGTGKTQMGTNLTQYLSFISQVANSLHSVGRFKVNFIICPPHLVDKWAGEITSIHNEKMHGKIKIIKVSRWTDLTPYTKRDMRKDGIKYYFIVSRETAKLGYPKQVAVNIKRRYITTEEELDGQTHMLQKLIQVAKCPDCDTTLQEGDEDYVDTSSIPHKCECGCVLRQVDKSVSPNMQSRISIAEYIKRNWTKGAIDLLIVDEIHEYKGGNTGQGNALAQLCSMSKKIVGLTGTLLNGYASSLFYILYRLNPHLMNKTLGFDYKQVRLFVDAYGAYEETVEAKEVNDEGVVTKKGKRIAIKEKPKISPHLLSVLLSMTIFLRLDEIKMEDGEGLPDYNEIVDLVPMDDELYGPYMQYISEISGRIRLDKRFLGNLANDSIAVPDMPFVPHSAQEEIFYEPKFTREEYGYTNKEKRLITHITNELNDGRQALVYVHFSNKGISDDLLEILEKEFPTRNIKVLRQNVSAKKRQAWIEMNPCDILICNPELVKTGLDLLEFPTIIFYETTYNVFTLKQASRRSWRIGQRDNVKVIFMAYEGTPQHIALELIGAKIAAANSLEGRLSGDDDLSSMADDEDNIQLALAKAILNGKSASKDIELTSISNFGNDRDWDAFELYYRELLEEYSLAQDEPQEVEEFEEEEIVNDVKITNEELAKYPVSSIAICVSPIEDIVKMYDTPEHIVRYILDISDTTLRDKIEARRNEKSIAETFGIKDNENIQICTMPKDDSDEEVVDDEIEDGVVEQEIESNYEFGHQILKDGKMYSLCGLGGSGIHAFKADDGTKGKIYVNETDIKQYDHSNNYGFSVGDTVAIRNQIAVFKEPECGGQLYVDLEGEVFGQPNTTQVYLNNSTASEFSFDLDSIEKEFTLESMIEEFARNLLNHHKSRELYDGVKKDYIGDDGKEYQSTSMLKGYSLFDINDKYRNGELYGLYVDYHGINNEEDFICHTTVYTVYYDEEVPFQKKEEVMFLSAGELHSSLCVIPNGATFDGLVKMLTARFKRCSFTEKSLIVEDENEETIVAYIGKGRKQKKVEVKASSSAEISGAQLAFNF